MLATTGWRAAVLGLQPDLDFAHESEIDTERDSQFPERTHVLRVWGKGYQQALCGKHER